MENAFCVKLPMPLLIHSKNKFIHKNAAFQNLIQTSWPDFDFYSWIFSTITNKDQINLFMQSLENKKIEIGLQQKNKDYFIIQINDKGVGILLKNKEKFTIMVLQQNKSVTALVYIQATYLQRKRGDC